MKRAYVFPGQGAQFTGMGKDLYDNNAEAKALFDKANEILGFDDFSPYYKILKYSFFIELSI